MGYARSHTIAADEAGAYHVMARCVRRAFLCGNDPITGKNFDHRKQWLEDRILDISQYFAIDVYAYAVMSNHFHIVIWADPRRADDWSNEEVARRWLQLFPPKVNGRVEPLLIPAAIDQINQDPSRIKELRQRLGSVSWFMRLINEPLARRSNAEDGVKGRFWESRFKSQALLDQAALLTCMAYVDLNPIRAGVCDELSQSFHTSARRRLFELEKLIDTQLSEKVSGSLQPVNQTSNDPIAGITVGEYIDLVDWTGRIVRPDKAGAIPASVPPALQKLGLPSDGWMHLFNRYQDPGWAFGSLESLIRHAQHVGKRWLKGVNEVKVDYSPPLKGKK